MALLRWMTQNRAATDPPTHLDLAPLVMAGSLEDVAGAIERAANQAKRWAVVARPSATELHLTRTTSWMSYTDDVQVTLRGEGDQVVVNARSQSRVGKGDLGQNRRNIRELWTLLQQEQERS